MSAKETLQNLPRFLGGPATRHFDITPHDTNDLPFLPLRLYVEGAGTLVVTDAEGTDATYTLPAHSMLEFRATKIKATGTTATGIKGHY